MTKWIEIMLNNSILMSAVILLLLLRSKLFFKKYSAKWQYYTWLIVIIGLLVPFRPTFDIIPVRIEPPVQIAAQYIIPVISKQPEPDDLLTNGTIKPTEIPSIPPLSGNDGVEPYWTMIVAAIWAVGFLVSLMYCILKHKRFVKAVRRWSYNFNNEETSALLNIVKAEFGVTKELEMKICKIISTPMLIGLIKPVILLPSNDFEYDELELIIRHELTHYKRKDLWYKALILFINAVHWFNPFVYVMAQAVSTDCEISCDEAVLKGKDLQLRMLYGETIISIIKNQSAVSTIFSTGFKGGKKVMEKRIFSIMDTANKKAGVIILCVVLTCTVLTGMFSTAYAQEKPATDLVKSGAVMGTATIKGETWYLIETEAQLRSIGSKAYPLSAKYLLNANITLSKKEDWIPLGTFDVPFTGSFIGNGYEIIDLTIKDISVKVIGMFAYAKNANIGNVILRSPDIESAFQKGDSIAPFVVFGLGDNEIYGNQIVDDVK